MRDETRQRVHLAIEALDYRPNAMARSLRTARAYTYGLLIPEFENPVYAAIISGAEEAAAARGSLLLAASDGTGGMDVRQHLQLLGQGRVDGLLLAGTLKTDRAEDLIATLQTPWLLLNRRTADSQRYVILDDEGAAAMATEHLLSLGHREIAHLAGPVDADTAERREAGYRLALERAGVAVDDGLIVRADYRSEHGAEATMSLFASGRRPTAVMVANLASALGAMHAIKAAGFRIPDDVSVVSIHDLPLAGYLDPPLTTVRMPLEELGRRGIELLSAVDPAEPIQEVVAGPTELIVRGSTGPPPAG